MGEVDLLEEAELVAGLALKKGNLLEAARRYEDYAEKLLEEARWEEEEHIEPYVEGAIKLYEKAAELFSRSERYEDTARCYEEAASWLKFLGQDEGARKHLRMAAGEIPPSSGEVQGGERTSDDLRHGLLGCCKML